MNKKIIRIFIAVCLMLAMTSSTAFAKTRTVTKIRNCYIYYNTSHDYAFVTKYKIDGKNGQTVSIKVVYTYDTHDKKGTIAISSADATIFGANAKRYYCEIKQENAKKVNFNLYDLKEDSKLGYIHAYITSGHFRYACYNRKGPS